ncbi:MAG TPA: glycosyltransferase family 1 protein [Candidatus Dormibacteraeota bacterium]|nr:glycosyltransferase family 1 protein [Candidatus Dormibacteraeota bacterium]
MTEGRLAVAYDMTFPNRNDAGSGGYARSLVEAVAARGDVETVTVAGPSMSGLLGTLGWMLRGAAASVATSGARLLHCPTFVTPWNVRVPVVITVHDVATRRFPQDYPQEWRLYEGRVLPGQARKAALVIAVSETTRQDVIAEYGLAPDRVVAIHSGVDPAFFAARAIEPEDVTKILFPGAPLARKNLDVVLRAMAAAPRDSRLARVVLQISGAVEAEFPDHAHRIASLGLDARVRWLGPVPRKQFPVTVAEAAAVVYPSLYEGFGFPPLEAMAAGTPVVASNAPCLPEVLGDAALLVDPLDDDAFAAALEDVLTKPEVRGRLIASGRRRAALYTWAACAEKTVAAYRQALGEAA